MSLRRDPVRPARALVALVLAAAVASCAGGPSEGGGAPAPGVAPTPGSAGSDADVTGDVVVLAAASLTGPFTELAARFEADHPGAHVVLGFGASSSLATQVTAGGAPADVLATASTSTMDGVVAAGAAADPVVVARAELAIAVPAGNPAGVTGLADLGRPGVRVAVCQAQVPCGALAARVLAAAGVTVRPVTEEADVKATLAKVELGEVDAGLVYTTDVRAAGGRVDAVAIPADVDASTDYRVAVLTGAPNPAGAAAFVALVRSAEGLEVLADAGFGAP